MSFREKKELPYTKQITVQKFIASYKGSEAISFQTDVLNAILKLKNKSLDVRDSVHIKCRKHKTEDEILIVFFSWYDEKIDISTTKQDANDSITSEVVNDADICHLFVAIKGNKLWAFTTISTLNILKRLEVTFFKLLKKSGLSIVNEINYDDINIIKNEKIKHIEVEGVFDLLSLGFQQENAFTKMFKKEKEKQAKQNYCGTLILGKKGMPQIIKNMQENPCNALNYLELDAVDSEKNIFIVTKKNHRIDGKGLKKSYILYLTPNGKTNTVHWSDVCNVFLSITKDE